MPWFEFLNLEEKRLTVSCGLWLCCDVVQRYEFSRDLNSEVATICETIQPVEVIPAAGAFRNHQRFRDAIASII